MKIVYFNFNCVILKPLLLGKKLWNIRFVIYVNIICLLLFSSRLNITVITKIKYFSNII